MKKTILALLCGIVLTLSANAQTMLPYPTDTIDGMVFYRYTPEKSIGLYRISKTFGVSQDIIIRYNPQLQQRGPRLDEMLHIPYIINDTIVKAVSETDTTSIRDTEDISVPHDTVIDTIAIAEIVSPDTTFAARRTDAVKIAMILPLRAGAIERDAGDDRFFDFYMGSLIAVKQATDMGIAVEMHIYDIEKGSEKIEQLSYDGFIHDADIIIGPAYSDQVAAVAPMAQADSTWLLVPFTSNVPDVENNPYILQFNPTAEAEAETMARYIAGRENEINVVVVEADKESVPHSIRALRNELKKQDIQLTSVTLKQILSDSLFASLKDSAENILIFNTERYSNLQILMPHIVAANQTHLITLMSQYSWQKENITVGQIFTSVFTDSLNEQRLSDYRALWQNYFPFTPQNTLPHYDLLGYDLTSHIINLIMQMRDIADETYADYLMKCVFTGIQSSVKFERVSENGGYINKGIQVITK